MSKYTKNLNPLPYENGFKDKPEKTTISASILNNWFSVLGRLEDWLYQHDILDISLNKIPAGEPSTQLNNLYVDGTIYTVSGGGGDLDDLTNVDISSPQEGDALVYDSTNQEWINSTVSSVDDLDDLSNVDIVNVVNGQALCYNGVTSKWENKTVSGGGGIDSSIIADDYDSTHYDYQKDEFVIYNDTLYKCLCDISGEAGDFAPECWDSVQVTDTVIPSSIYNPTDGQVLTYDSSSKAWVNGNGGGNANIWTGTKAEYEAQASQIEDDTVVLITDDEEHTQAFDVYSTDEQVIGTWLGETLYRKVYQYTGSSITCTTNTWTKIPFITGVNTLKDGKIYDSNGTLFLGMWGKVDGEIAFYNLRNTAITIDSGSEVMVEYTKTS